MWNVKFDLCSDKTSANIHPTLKFPSALQTHQHLSAHCFSALINLVSRQDILNEKALINPLYATCPAPKSRQAKLANQLVNMAEHLAAKESDILVRKKKSKEKSVYLTDSLQAARKTTSNEC